MQFLLSNTYLHQKVNNATEINKIQSNVGTPQKDSLSPVIFVIYLEVALKELRRETELDIIQPNEIIYSDDVDFIILEKYRDVDKIQEVLYRHHLKVNIDKTEYATIKRDLDDWKKSKKVRSLLWNKEDIQRRKTKQQPPTTD